MSEEIGGQAGATVPTGIRKAAATDDVFSSGVTADSVDRFVVDADGKMWWGPGSGASDIQFARSGVQAGTFTGQFGATQSVYATSAGNYTAIGALGPGGEPCLSLVGDTRLYRVSAGVFGTAAVIKLTKAGVALQFGDAGQEQTTVGAAGGASALPATPSKYIKILDSAGATLVIPAYAAA